jgi:hypothetical protein
MRITPTPTAYPAENPLLSLPASTGLLYPSPSCEVLTVEPIKRLSHVWNASGTEGGVVVRMGQSGLRPEEDCNYQEHNTAGSTISTSCNAWPLGWPHDFSFPG